MVGPPLQYQRVMAALLFHQAVVRLKKEAAYGMAG